VTRIQHGQLAALVMAGGINTIPLYEGYRPGYKALVEIGGQPAIRYPLDALKRSRHVGEICVVGSQEQLRDAVGDSPVTFVPPGKTLLESIVAGLTRLREHEVVLATTADLPLVSAGILDTFIEACTAAPAWREASLFVSVVPRHAFTGPFARVDKITAHFRDGIYCHGNVMLVRPAFLDNASAMQRINAMYAGRKGALTSAMALGVRVGLAFVFGVYVFHLLTMRQMAALASARFHVGIVPVPMPHPELSLDLDEPADYRLITEILTQKGTAGTTTGPVG
jgi:CTP:molybdopterin cytidylyltransferase MocA